MLVLYLIVCYFHNCYYLLKIILLFSSSSENEESVEDDESSTNHESPKPSTANATEPVTLKSLFPSMKEVYGCDVTNPCEDDIFKYKKWVY